LVVVVVVKLRMAFLAAEVQVDFLLVGLGQQILAL
jgi:hypothetical protein